MYEFSGADAMLTQNIMKTTKNTVSGTNATANYLPQLQGEH